jgi:hypothetical protein
VIVCVSVGMCVSVCVCVCVNVWEVQVFNFEPGNGFGDRYFVVLLSTYR